MNQQLPLFPMDAPYTDEEAPDPLVLLRNGAALVLSVSGGKDSDAMSHHLLDLRQSEVWSGAVMMATVVGQYIYRLLHRQPIYTFLTYISIGDMPASRSLPICREELEIFLLC